MKENVREEERDTTTHLIKIPVFTHASRVTKFSVCHDYCTASGYKLSGILKRARCGVLHHVIH